ncbi:MAG TPA: SGNH/GDSL hydrolase family protein, partial [Verrucomicrobiae bacterium]|nr:SGNH/GDSL hydrolase family protein [Verrucomicrobiae bacterium]
MSYPAILGRMLDIDFVNLGFSGNGLGEPEVARAVAEIDAACFVLDFGANHKTFAEMQNAYGPFLDILRSRHPATPILVLSPIYTTREARSNTFKQDWQRRRAFLRATVEHRRKSGDKHIGFVEGTDLLGPARGDGLVDGSHPNDLGFHWMAEGLAPYLRETVKLHQTSATSSRTRQ